MPGQVSFVVVVIVVIVINFHRQPPAPPSNLRAKASSQHSIRPASYPEKLQPTVHPSFAVRICLSHLRCQPTGGGGLPPLYTISLSMYLSSSRSQAGSLSRGLTGGGASSARRGAGSSGPMRLSHPSSLTRRRRSLRISSERPTIRATSSCFGH